MSHVRILFRGKSTVHEPYSKHVLKCLVDDLKFLDYKKFIVKSDQENALSALRERIRQVRSATDEQNPSRRFAGG